MVKEGVHVAIWKKGIPSRGTIKGKGQVSRAHLVCFKNNKNDGKAGKKCAENRERNQFREKQGSKTTEDILGQVRTLYSL